MFFVAVLTLQSFEPIAPPFLNLDPGGIFGGGADIIFGAIGTPIPFLPPPIIGPGSTFGLGGSGGVGGGSGIGGRGRWASMSF